jgi:hypothetical protein
VFNIALNKYWRLDELLDPMTVEEIMSIEGAFADLHDSVPGRLRHASKRCIS